MFHPSHLTRVRLWAVITLQSLWWEIGGRRRSWNSLSSDCRAIFSLELKEQELMDEQETLTDGWWELRYFIYEHYVKSFPSHKTHRAALISILLALSQTPVYTARPWIRSWCIVRCARWRPSLRWCSSHLPTEGWPGWVDLGDWLHTEMVNPLADGHTPSKY